jgi:hypothetical protein
MPSRARSQLVLAFACLSSSALSACNSSDSNSTGQAGTSGGGGTGGPVVPGDCSDPGTLASSGTLMGRYGKVRTWAGGNREYFLQINQWNNASATGMQTMAYGGPFFFKMTQQTAMVATNGGPTGFPSMFIGGNSNNVTQGSNLPKLVSSLTTVPTSWVWADGGSTDTGANSYNATYDVWFSTSPEGEPAASAPTGGFLMVWLYDPPDAQPLGSRQASAQTIPNIPGVWDIWVGTNAGHPCISYVRTEKTLSMSFDLNDFIKHAVGRGNVQNAWYLTNIFVGFEIWRGGLNLETTSFCAVVN